MGILIKIPWMIGVLWADILQKTLHYCNFNRVRWAQATESSCLLYISQDLEISSVLETTTDVMFFFVFSFHRKKTLQIPNLSGILGT